MKHEEISLNTKKALAESLKKAMKSKPFSKITVSEIIADCNVNRKTFYYHFEDIYALLHWMLENEAVQVVQQFDLLVDYEEAILFVMDYVEKNEHIINCALDSIGREEMKRFFYSDFVSITESLIHDVEKAQGVYLDSNYRHFLIDFYTEALAGMLINWIKNGKKEEREQMIDNIFTTLKGSLLGIFQNLGTQP